MKLFYLLFILTIVSARPEESTREAKQTKSFLDPDDDATMDINPDNPFLQEYLSNKPEKQTAKRTSEEEDYQDETIGKKLYLSPTIEETLRRKQLEKENKKIALTTPAPITEDQEDEQENPGRNTQFSIREKITRNPTRNEQFSYSINNLNDSQLDNANNFNQLQYTRFPINSIFQTNSDTLDSSDRQYTRVPLNTQQFLIPGNLENSGQTQFQRIPITQQFTINSNNPDSNPSVLQFLGNNQESGTQNEQESANLLESIIRNTLISGTDAFIGGILNANRNGNQQETSIGGNRIVLPTRITQRPTTNFFPTSQDAELFVNPSRVVTTQQIVRRPERIIRPNNIVFPQERVQLFDV